MREDEIVKYYDSQFNDKRSRYYRIREILPDDIGNSWDILDYGTGTGFYAVWLKRTFDARVDAVDISFDEICKAKSVWGKEGVDFFTIDKLNPLKQYDMVVSNQVMEHVHNHGEYMNRVNKMTKIGGYYIVSIPNVSNIRFIFSTIFSSSNNKLKRLSKIILSDYDKGRDHIHSWDPSHFVSLISSCGFEFEAFIPMEGMALPFRFPKPYVNRSNKTKLGNLSYTMAFRFRKVRDVEWGIDA